MRTLSLIAVLSLTALSFACDNKPQQAATPPADSGSKAPAPIVTDILKPVTDANAAISKAADDTNAKLEAAKADVEKYTKQVNDLTAQVTDLTKQRDEAQAAYDKVMADAKAKAAPFQDNLNKVKTQIEEAKKAADSLKLGMCPKIPGETKVGLLDGISGNTLSSLTEKANGYQKQIDDIMAQAQAAGLPYMDKVKSLTSSLATVTSSLTTAQGYLSSAKTKFASLTGGAAK